jgi:hypothetical protein
LKLETSSTATVETRYFFNCRPKLEMPSRAAVEVEYHSTTVEA